MRVKILVSTTQAAVAPALRQNLDRDEFEVSSGSPEVPAVDQILDYYPDILVVEPSPSRTLWSSVISTARKICPHLKIVLVTLRSSPDDAKIVEQGLFYYTVWPAVDELVQVVHAAARAIRRETARNPGRVPDDKHRHQRRSRR